MLKKTWQKLLFGGFILLLIGAGIYWYIATDTFSDTKGRKAEYSVKADDFLKEFQADNKNANLKYTEKIVEVSGTVSATEAADSSINIKIADTTTGSYVIFAFQDKDMAEAKTIKQGDLVSIKGSCSGGVYSNILETWAITFKRSTLSNKP
ncbi:MAG: hypothetical protein B7Z54_01795 [Sphingobacteriales bacterium 12-47-4]|nr:MAG: hypothetical protein B7Z54_01795 [Sphingobacteriales bacterium 12-47-4]